MFAAEPRKLNAPGIKLLTLTPPPPVADKEPVLAKKDNITSLGPESTSSNVAAERSMLLKTPASTEISEGKPIKVGGSFTASISIETVPSSTSVPPPIPVLPLSLANKEIWVASTPFKFSSGIYCISKVPSDTAKNNTIGIPFNSK